MASTEASPAQDAPSVRKAEAAARPARRSGASAARHRLRFMTLFLVLLGLVGLLAVALAQSMLAENAARERVRRTTDVVSLLRDSWRVALEAETSQRGYLLTSDPAYLAPLRAARESLPDHLDRLSTAAAISGLPFEPGTQERLKQLARQKIDEMDRTVALVDAGRRDEAIALSRSDLGFHLMGDFRRLLQSMERVELEELAAAIDEAARTEKRSVPIVVALLAAILVLFAIALLLERRMVRSEIDRRDMAAATDARERSELMARELNHRVKNLFAVIMSLITLTGRGESQVPAAMSKLRLRVHALARAHAITQGHEVGRTVDLGELVEATLEPYLGEGRRIEVAGPPATLPVRAITPVGLILHELATNAVKYGALAQPEGRIHVGWSLQGEEGRRVALRWRETGVALNGAAPGPDGFGTTMMTQAARQLGGTAERVWTADGLDFTLTIPLAEPDEGAHGMAA